MNSRKAADVDSLSRLAMNLLRRPGSNGELKACVGFKTRKQLPAWIAPGAWGSLTRSQMAYCGLTPTISGSASRLMLPEPSALRIQLAQEQSLHQRSLPLRRVGSRVDHTGAVQSLLSRHGDRRTQFRRASLQTCAKSGLSLSMSALPCWPQLRVMRRQIGERWPIYR
jgi:hypothetical protein